MHMVVLNFVCSGYIISSWIYVIFNHIIQKCYIATGAMHVPMPGK